MLRFIHKNAPTFSPFAPRMISIERSLDIVPHQSWRVAYRAPRPHAIIAHPSRGFHPCPLPLKKGAIKGDHRKGNKAESHNKYVDEVRDQDSRNRQCEAKDFHVSVRLTSGGARHGRKQAPARDGKSLLH